MANVLIIDDDTEMCLMLADLITSISHHAKYVHTLAEGLDLAISGTFDVIFLDVRMPDGNGLEILHRIRTVRFPPEVIIITGAGDPDGAEIAVRNGAWDYLRKPLSPKKIILPLKRVLQYRDGIKDIRKPPVLLWREGIIGESPRIKACLTTLAQAAHTDVSVLITGETGTGKELFARAIHHNSARAKGRFVVVDCAVLPETLTESALFGYEKGAFTGSDGPKEGLIRRAHGGTLFLDEIGELPPNLQKTFLRVLQERCFRPVGSNKEIKSDFRLVAATNRIPEKMVRSGMFREDLLYRLRGISIELPSLRDRITDMKDLVVYLTGRIFDRHGLEPKGYSPDFIRILSSYDWPGNIRELVHTLEAALSEAYYEPILFPKHLPEHIRIKMARSAITPPHRPDLTDLTDPAEKKHLQKEIPLFKEYRKNILSTAESSYLKDLMAATRGNIKQACVLSGLGRTRLYTLMKKHGID
ncbi:sigma-54 dependent transcriptional regulator, partial [Desulfobacterales bacterium HSG16]|nr:sigma-54 dependent transcriptional regulator [Desulfobacterales bacterium HSG16]